MTDETPSPKGSDSFTFFTQEELIKLWKSARVTFVGAAITYATVTLLPYLQENPNNLVNMTLFAVVTWLVNTARVWMNDNTK